jgi:hypothetical protein
MQNERFIIHNGIRPLNACYLNALDKKLSFSNKCFMIFSTRGEAVKCLDNITSELEKIQDEKNLKKAKNLKVSKY